MVKYYLCYTLNPIKYRFAKIRNFRPYRFNWRRRLGNYPYSASMGGWISKEDFHKIAQYHKNDTITKELLLAIAFSDD